jgi:ATP-dependent Clp protease ATP-binding subunit ClpC
MFERFTHEARAIVTRAQAEASALGHDNIGTEHLLLALGRRHRTCARGRVLDHRPFTPRAKKALELSLREALALGHRHIGAGHVALGVVRDRDSGAARALERCGTHPDRVRTAVLALLRPAA